MERSDEGCGPISIDQVATLYPGEWVVLQVTDIDEGGVITHGYVLKHSILPKEITRTVRAARKRDPKAHLYVFVGGTRAVSGEEFRTMVAQAARRDYINARW